MHAKSTVSYVKYTLAYTKNQMFAKKFLDVHVSNKHSGKMYSLFLIFSRKACKILLIILRKMCKTLLIILRKMCIL